MIRLRHPSAALHPSWVEAMREFAGETLHGFGTHGFDVEELAEPEGFARWLEREQQQNARLVEGLVPATVWWIDDDERPGRVLGSLQLRHELNGHLLEEGGHIGCGVRPTARGRGVATEALRLVLDRAQWIGLDDVLVTCDDDNPASRAVILAAGGELEDVRGGIERYWIALT